MYRRMLINARHQEECRVAIEEKGSLLELEIDSTTGQTLKGNVYKARISRIEPSLQAAFIDIGSSKNAFLQINDIHPSYFNDAQRYERVHPSKVRIQDVLEAGQELVVQVVKEEREQKGATLTTYLSLPGRYLVLMPGSEKGGVSRKIMDESSRRRLRKLAKELEMPSGMGMIVRTAGLDRSMSELSRDLSLLIKLWEHIVEGAQEAECPEVLYKESDLAISVIRDYFTPAVREVIVDEESAFERVKSFVERTMPRYRSRIKFFEQPQPIFSHFDIEQQVANTLNREVQLPSGGSIVIEQLEALVAIDVNSGKATSGGDIEETAFQTNLEAAEEVARQLRLRDLGGLIVIDFIDMWDKRHKADVEHKVREVVEEDKARIEIGRLSKFGLLEMSRQRMRASLSSQSHQTCHACNGRGKLQNPELVALQALRKIQTAVMAGHLALVKCRMAPMPALFLLNNKRCDLNELEDEYGVKIVVLADSRLLPDDYEIQLEASQAKSRGVSGTSKSTRSRRNVLKRARERKSRRGEDENGSQASAKSADNTNAVDPSDSKAEGDHLDDVDSAATADS